MTGMILIAGLIIIILALVFGILVQGYSVSDVIAAGWLRLKAIWREWRR